ncbi:uncharacterized protein F4822DRAFT_98583 [Hypoxylon trugodes]|uniref:uncharacterized protein n=1 Tax=Hypoxylon trugodes TaxID=326681 RepID=UPI0021A1B8A3|nr:uncharacterized protein F4822DRAFT_98583 [Hypoxylon trugodes]KAI1382847.1 hypothetical protein F4822DRAFT_98583 [Hypoxylon trugodes]
MTEAPEDVERLYSESQAATALFQCFSQACPVDDHSSHTVYLGVSTDERTHMGIQSRATSQNRVWFCVRSNPTAKRRKESMSSTVMQVMNTSSRKRKRPSDIPMRFHRPLKSRKANRSQAMNQVQVCPEYLTQGEDSNLAMRMVAAPREWHNIYFLESEKRPPDGHMPMKLANLFDDSRREHRYDFSWRVHVARLIAEAVLRIQHPESPCRWCEKDVVFYTAEPYDDNLKPFLKVEVERGGDGTTLNIAAARKPGRWLLNLALILLELGLSQHIEAPPDGMGEEEYREHILWHVEQAKGRSLEKYLTVVRSCVTINSRGEGGRITVDEHSFHEDFYRLIIFPLKMIENDLKPPEYLSNTYYPMAGFSEDNR